MLPLKRPAAVALAIILTASAFVACGAGGDLIEPSADGGASADECRIPPMDEQYTGSGLPDLTKGIEAPSCLATKHDVIVVLGCPTGDDGTPSECQTARVEVAMRAMRAGLGDTFIVTGGAVQNAYVEAETLRDMLVARGVAADRVVVEPKAEHTDENLYWSSEIMKARGWQRAVVVSDDARHLVMTALCDANCCVRRGRLTVFDFALTDAAGAVVKAPLGHYELYPKAQAVSDGECAALRPKLMCLILEDRRACEGRVTMPLDGGADGGSDSGD